MQRRNGVSVPDFFFFFIRVTEENVEVLAASTEAV